MNTKRLILVLVLLIVIFSIIALERTKVSSSPLLEITGESLGKSSPSASPQPAFKDGKYPLAPELTGIVGYINTNDDLKIAHLRGKVVLVDFWTYSCINCIRTSPYLISWYEKYHDKDKELAFYKFYYQLLKRRIKDDVPHYVFLDFRPSKNKNSVRRLGEFLGMFSKGVKHIQSYPSNENVFIQIADILTGAVAFSYNSPDGSENKNKLIKIIAKSVGKETLKFCSAFWEQKFNIFCIDLTKRT